MGSYYSPGEREKDNALSSMLAWAQYQKTQGKNFFGQELKVDPELVQTRLYGKQKY